SAAAVAPSALWRARAVTLPAPCPAAAAGVLATTIHAATAMFTTVVSTAQRYRAAVTAASSARSVLWRRATPAIRQSGRVHADPWAWRRGDGIPPPAPDPDRSSAHTRS